MHTNAIQVIKFSQLQHIRLRGGRGKMKAENQKIKFRYDGHVRANSTIGDGFRI